MFQWKLIAGVAVMAVIGGLIAVQHITHRKLVAANARANQAEANYAAERENTRKANEASTKYQADLAALRTARADNPLPAVVCKRPRVPEARATPGPDAARPADNPPEDAGDRDIGPQLDDFATACEANLSQLTRLQEWVRAR